MTMEVALAMLAASAPITVAVVKFRPGASRSAGVSEREFRLFAASTKDSLGVLRADIRELRALINDRL